MAKKNKGGRPLWDGKDEEKVLSKLEEAFSWGATDHEACIWAEISERTLYRYIEKHPSFGRKKEGLKNKPNLLAKRNVEFALQKGDVNTAKWQLENRASDEYSKNTKNDINLQGDLTFGWATNEDNNPVQAEEATDTSSPK